MLNEKTRKYIVILIGAVLVFLGLAADFLGIGNSEGLGPKQKAFIIIGFLFLVSGFVNKCRYQCKEPPSKTS